MKLIEKVVNPNNDHYASFIFTTQNDWTVFICKNIDVNLPDKDNIQNNIVAFNKFCKRKGDLNPDELINNLSRTRLYYKPKYYLTCYTNDTVYHLICFALTRLEALKIFRDELNLPKRTLTSKSWKQFMEDNGFFNPILTSLIA